MELYTAKLPLVNESRESLTTRLRRFFEARPGRWIDGRALAGVAGNYAWRTRVSNLRRPPFSMCIENRQRHVRTEAGRVVVSEYRYQPDALKTGASATASADDAGCRV